MARKREATVKIEATLLLVALAVSIHSASGATPMGEYQIALKPDHIAVDLSGSLYQNVTTTSPFRFTIAGFNSTTLAEDLNGSLRGLDPQVRVDHPVLTAHSNGTILTYNLTFSVLGAIRSYLGGSLSADLAWRSFNIQEDIQANGTFFNLVGKHDLGQSLVILAKNSLTPSPGHTETVTFQMGSARVSPLQMIQLAPNLNLLDFSPLSSPLDSWPGGFNIDAQMTSWTSHAGFDILAKISLSEATGQSVTTSEEATYAVTVTLNAPGFAYPRGNLVYFGSNFLEPLFAAVIIFSLAILTLTVFADRRLSRRSRVKRK